MLIFIWEFFKSICSTKFIHLKTLIQQFIGSFQLRRQYLEGVMKLTENRQSDQSSNLNYSSLGVQNEANFQRLSDSLQYLDRIRSINKKIFDSKPINQNSIISPLEKLIHIQRQITYIDNERLYGIIKIQSLNNLKNRIKQLQQQQETYKINENDLNKRLAYLEKQNAGLKQKQSDLLDAIDKISEALNKEKLLRAAVEQRSLQISDSLSKINREKTQDSLKYISLMNDYASLTANALAPSSLTSKHQMICQTQTQFDKPTIQFPSFEPNLEDILRKIREKQGEKVSRQTLKQVIAQSLNTFVKELEAQYKIIHEQTIDLNKIREVNYDLINENNHLKEKIQLINIQEEKLKIFRNCMASFLEETSQNVSKSIESERINKRTYENLTENQRTNPPKTIPEVELINQGANQNTQISQLRDYQESMENLKKQNIQLLKTIGDYQFKMRRVEKVLDESRREQIPDDGTVGQLVKMSKLVKESIKSLLQQL